VIKDTTLKNYSYQKQSGTKFAGTPLQADFQFKNNTSSSKKRKNPFGPLGAAMPPPVQPFYSIGSKKQNILGSAKTGQSDQQFEDLPMDKSDKSGLN
jgi:hypothetical protein